MRPRMCFFSCIRQESHGNRETADLSGLKITYGDGGGGVDHPRRTPVLALSRAVVRVSGCWCRMS